MSSSTTPVSAEQRLRLAQLKDALQVVTVEIAELSQVGSGRRVFVRSRNLLAGGEPGPFVSCSDIGSLLEQKGVLKRQIKAKIAELEQ